MGKWQFWGSVQLAVALGLAGGLPIAAQENPENMNGGMGNIVDESEQLPPPALTVTDWLAQIEASLVQITGVRIETTETGLQIMLDTIEGRELDTPQTRIVGNALIAEIPNAVLELPDADQFEVAEPTPGIAFVSVTALGPDRVQIAITGMDAPPVAEVTATGLTVTLGEAVVGDEDEAIQVVVTGQQDEGYFVPDASVGTRTDTAILDTPQSIQVVPRQVIEDQQIQRLGEVLQNVPGAGISISPRTARDVFLIRGFNSSNNILRNGIRDTSSEAGGFDPATIDRVEVLKGPSSVLFGDLAPGGIINLVTKEPLKEPFYQIEANVGSFDFYRGAIDLSGPLDGNGKILYRFNAAAQTSKSFIDFLFDRRYIIAPTISININDNTNLNIWGQYNYIENSFDLGVPAIGSVLSNPLGKIPKNRNVTDPNNFLVNKTLRLGFDLEHKFSEQWQWRIAFLTSFFREDTDFVFSRALLADNRTLTRGFSRGTPVFDEDFYNFDSYVTGNFFTGKIKHQLTTGINLTWNNSFVASEGAGAEPLDIFNPVYTEPITPFQRDFGVSGDSNLIGLYVQDQIDLFDNFTLLIGGRFDFANQTQKDLLANTNNSNSYQEFSPRLGMVYKPIEPISLYASYSSSFNLPDLAFSDVALEPEFGTQYEVGVKLELNERLSTTLALFNLTRSNLPTIDPNNPLKTIQVGEQRSRAIEFDISGEILPGWNIIAGYALINAEITEDNNFPVGNTLNNVPNNSFNLWTTYEIQSGDLQGLGFGLGFFYVDNRQGDLANSFELPSYFRTDLGIFYRREKLRVALNIKNLFDVDYFPSAQNRNRVFRGDPFNVQGTISWEF